MKYKTGEYILEQSGRWLCHTFVPYPQKVCLYRFVRYIQIKTITFILDFQFLNCAKQSVFKFYIKNYGEVL